MDGPESTSSASILCVDDLADNLVIRKLMLGLFGYRVLTAANPPEALKVLATETVDQVLLDYRFPGYEDGESLAREIRSRWPKVKLLMLSGFPDVPDSARKSVDAFVLKGADPPQLRGTLEELLERRQTRKPAANVQSQNVELRKRSKTLLKAARRSLKRKDIA